MTNELNKTLAATELWENLGNIIGIANRRGLKDPEAFATVRAALDQWESEYHAPVSCQDVHIT